MSLHPLLQRLAEAPRARAVDPASLDAWLGEPGEHVLLFAGDPVRFPEALDVAVVLPELQAAFAGRFDVGVVPREHEDRLARRFGVQRWPSLVFLRGDGYLATVSGMHDWTDYVAEVARAVEQDVSRAPSVGIPVVAAGAAASACR
jgi:hydrogenase-1 operon protein HyaE